MKRLLTTLALLVPLGLLQAGGPATLRLEFSGARSAAETEKHLSETLTETPDRNQLAVTKGADGDDCLLEMNLDKELRLSQIETALHGIKGSLHRERLRLFGAARLHLKSDKNLESLLKAFAERLPEHRVLRVDKEGEMPRILLVARKAADGSSVTGGRSVGRGTDLLTLAEAVKILQHLDNDLADVSWGPSGGDHEAWQCGKPFGADHIPQVRLPKGTD